MNWRARLSSGDVVLIDGGTGSELKRRGVQMSAAAWSGLAVHTHPEVVRAVHAAYVDAGAEVIVANTFGTTRSLLQAAGLGREFERINRRAVELAMEARDAAGKTAADVAIAGSLSNLPPNMNKRDFPPPTQEIADLKALARMLVVAGVDLIALEMMQDTHHARRALAAALETGLPVWLGVSARYRDDDSNRLVGFDYPEVDFADSLAALIPMGPDVVNVMHTEVAAVAPAIDRVRERWQGPVGVYPEVPYVVSPTWRTEVSPARLVAEAKTWVGQGARLIGGCCGTTPEHIAALAVWLRSGAG